MESQAEFPKSLMQAIRYFADPNTCVEFVAGMRWPNGVTCPYCSGAKVSFLKTRRIWKCMAKECHKQFSAKTWTIFEDSPIPLDKWLTAVWLVVNCKNGVSSYEVARDLKVTQKSAWFMLHRIRLALQHRSIEYIGGSEGGPIEIDETFVGGKPKNMHAQKRYKLQAENKSQMPDKAIVFGMLERKTRQVRAKVIPNVKREVLQAEILNQVTAGSAVFTDAHGGYQGLAAEYLHETVSHMNEYVRGEIHTNGIENFWSLLKRSLNGT
jgi:hypothetical protein